MRGELDRMQGGARRMRGRYAREVRGRIPGPAGADAGPGHAYGEHGHVWQRPLVTLFSNGIHPARCLRS